MRNNRRTGWGSCSAPFLSGRFDLANATDIEDGLVEPEGALRTSDHVELSLGELERIDGAGAVASIHGCEPQEGDDDCRYSNDTPTHIGPWSYESG